MTWVNGFTGFGYFDVDTYQLVLQAKEHVIDTPPPFKDNLGSDQKIVLSLCVFKCPCQLLRSSKKI